MASSLPKEREDRLPARRLSVRKTKEVLRLRFEVGLGLRQIARSCSIGLGTVYDYLQRAEAAGVTWPLGEDCVRRQLFLWVDDNYFSRSTTTTL
jgi:hypothetical protein